MRKKTLRESETKDKKILFKKLNFNEFKKKKSFHNNSAIKEVLIKPYNEFDKVLKTLKKNKFQNNLIIGTNDHTNTLIKLFNIKGRINADYLEINENDVYKPKKGIKNFNKITKISKKYDLVLISSYEHQFEIEKKFSLLNQENYNQIYNSTNRSIIDYAHIKKFGSKKLMYSKKTF